GQQFGVNRLLGLEMKIEGGRRIAGLAGDQSEARAFQTLLLEHLACRLQDEIALVPGNGLLPAGLRIHPASPSSSCLDSLLTLLNYLDKLFRGRHSMLMTADDYRESLRSYRPRVYVNGSQVESVADEPLLQPGINAVGV